MKPEVKISAADVICIRLLIEEGIFIQRIMHQHNAYPDASCVLALVVMPFLALIEHDSIPYLEKKFNLDLPRENADLSRIRHKTKSIDSRYLNYQKYSEGAATIIEESKKQFHRRGIMRLMPFSAKDIGISYFNGLPIYSTFSVANMLNDDKNSLWNNASKDYCSTVGFNAGSTCAFHYCLADQIIKDKSVFQSTEFVVTANDFSYSSLMDCRIKKQTSDECVFFFLTDQLLRLSSIEALREGGFLEEYLWLKLSTVYLFHAFNAIESFRGFAYRPTQSLIYSQDFLKQCSEIFPRDEAKLIKKMKKLRNAFVHYDFEDLISPLLSGSRDFVSLLETAVKSKMNIGLSQYESFLSDSLDRTIGKLKEITGFPEYNPMRNVF